MKFFFSVADWRLWKIDRKHDHMLTEIGAIYLNFSPFTFFNFRVEFKEGFGSKRERRQIENVFQRIRKGKKRRMTRFSNLPISKIENALSA